MEYAVHQSLKMYAGGLGFLAGSHMRSAYELKQNVVGIGILWKYGYYEQVRKTDQTMDVLFEEKKYGFLQQTNIKFTIQINNHDVWVTASYLPPEVFHTAPLFFYQLIYRKMITWQKQFVTGCTMPIRKRKLLQLFFWVKAAHICLII
jgi:starch phosphorylase